MNQQVIKDFKSAWEFVRSMTYDFIDVVPEEMWHYSPHEKYSAFSKQVRHLICVQGCYTDALLNRVADFSKKHSYYSGGLDRTELVEGLRQMDARMLEILKQLPEADIISIDFFGSQMGLTEYFHTMVQHESIHHGLWSFYSTLGQYSPPRSWKQNWEL